MTEEVYFARGFLTSLSIPQEALHLDMLVRGFNDREITQHLQRVFPLSVDEEREWLRKLPQRTSTDQVFIIVAHDEMKRIPIGTMGLHSINLIHGVATTGAAIVNKDYWGKTHGSEAKMLLLKYAFDSLGLRKIKSNVMASNVRSKRYNERCGYHVEGVLRAEKLSNGVYVDEYLMATTRDAWLPIWNQYMQNANGSITG